MKKTGTIAVVGLALFVAVLAFGHAASAGTKPLTEPPYGLKIEGAVAGAKLTGFLSVKLSDCGDGDCTYQKTAEAVTRLRSGSQLDIFPVTLTDGHFSNSWMAETQGAIIEAMGPAIVDRFFPGQCFSTGTDDGCLHIYLKNLDEWSFTTVGCGPGCSDWYVMLDITLAVK